MPTNFESYIDQFPESTQVLLISIQKAIKEAAPHAEECISYGMPAFKQNGKPLVYFAAYRHHIGFYATPTGHEAFKDELSKYKQGKGSVQFPINDPIPLDLIQRITQFRVKSILSA